jgi:starvation-inducible DNA-binding protein
LPDLLSGLVPNNDRRIEMAKTMERTQGAVRDTERVGATMQEALVDLTALALNGKQAHWHVRGPQFLAVHEQLDAIVSDARGWADLVAERSVTLGVPVDGRAATVAAEAAVTSFPTGFVQDARTVVLVRDLVDTVVERLRSHLEELGELDPVTQDLVIQILAGLEKHRWMLDAQAA